MENTSNVQADVAAEMGEQYSLARILGIWAVAALPMPPWVGSLLRPWHPISDLTP
jgi:hypothetical protein